MKRAKVNQEKHRKTENSEDRKRRKMAENGGKGRTLKIELQILPETCPKDFITDFVFSIFFLS